MSTQRAPAPPLRAWDGIPLPLRSCSEITRVALDIFPDRSTHKVHGWITLWSDDVTPKRQLEIEILVRDWIQSQMRSQHSLHSSVLQWRIKGIALKDAQPFWGDLPSHAFETQEPGGMRFWIKLQGVKHPGLFLDHAPLRQWLLEHSPGLRVLNTFAYTGSLSVAALLGGASEVVTVDLSKATVDWARQNLGSQEREAPAGGLGFWAADVLQWLPQTTKMIRAGKRPAFDLVILDPPSFSRSKSGVFSTEKDLLKLHGMALDVLNHSGGRLVTSVNSEFLSQEDFVRTVHQAARGQGIRLELLRELAAPEPFPRAQIKGGIFAVR